MARGRKKPWGYDSRGIPFSIGCLPVLLFLVAMITIGIVAPDLTDRCLGIHLDPHRGKAGIVYAVIELACSPFLLFGSMEEIAAFAFLLGVVGLSIYCLLWIRKHQAYWDVIRAKESERRKQKRLERKQKEPD